MSNSMIILANDDINNPIDNLLTIFIYIIWYALRVI